MYGATYWNTPVLTERCYLKSYDNIEILKFCQTKAQPGTVGTSALPEGCNSNRLVITEQSKAPLGVEHTFYFKTVLCVQKAVQQKSKLFMLLVKYPTLDGPLCMSPNFEHSLQCIGVSCVHCLTSMYTKTDCCHIHRITMSLAKHMITPAYFSHVKF